MSECSIGLECVFDNFGFCVNRDYCQELANPLELPYTIQFSHQYNCNETIVDEYTWDFYEENTIKDLHECGWSLPSQFPYDFYPLNGDEDYSLLSVVNYLKDSDCIKHGWHPSIVLPYIHKFNRELNKFCIFVCSDRVEGFCEAKSLPYKFYKNDWGVNTLEVVQKHIAGWAVAINELTFETSWVKEGKCKLIPCHTVVFERRAYGFAIAVSLPYKKIKNNLTVIKTLQENGYMKAVPVELPKHEGLPVIKASIYYCFPENLRLKPN